MHYTLNTKNKGSLRKRFAIFQYLQVLSDKEKLPFVVPRKKVSIYKSFMGEKRYCRKAKTTIADIETRLTTEEDSLLMNSK